MGEEENKNQSLQTDPETGRRWRPISDDERARAAEIYAKMEADEAAEIEENNLYSTVSAYIDSDGKPHQVQVNKITGEKRDVPLPGLGYNNEIRVEQDSEESSKETYKPNQEDIDEISRVLIHAHVFSLNPDLARQYDEALRKFKNGEMKDEDFQKEENNAISFLNTMNSEVSYPVDERDLVTQARGIASIEDTKRRGEVLDDLISPLLEEE